MPIPQPGDILIRNLTADHYELVDAVTVRFLSGPIGGFPQALSAARARHPRAVWRQNTDGRGRPMGDPFKLPDAGRC